MKDNKNYIKGQGAQINPNNRFSRYNTTYEEDLQQEIGAHKTQFIDVFPKTILNKVPSPDVYASYSINPYQGCEHGCIYCYARPSHQYWGYSAGVDFERTILVKKNAPELLKKQLSAKKYQVGTIALSGNTDCYQPIEKKHQLTRQILQICLEFKQPISIITKNALLLRDIDLLEELAFYNLLLVNMSITSLKEELRRILEPRTASSQLKLQTIQKLVAAKIPVHVFMAPIIPSINDTEIFSIAKEVANYGAQSMSYQIVRLEGPNQSIFTDWISRHFPDRVNKVLNQIREMHNGELNNTAYNQRMKGTGIFASMIEQQHRLARKKYHLESLQPNLRCDLFKVPNADIQPSLF